MLAGPARGTCGPCRGRKYPGRPDPCHVIANAGRRLHGPVARNRPVSGAIVAGIGLACLLTQPSLRQVSVVPAER
jgi:hypothetical protein